MKTPLALALIQKWLNTRTGVFYVCVWWLLKPVAMQNLWIIAILLFYMPLKYQKSLLHLLPLFFFLSNHFPWLCETLRPASFLSNYILWLTLLVQDVNDCQVRCLSHDCADFWTRLKDHLQAKEIFAGVSLLANWIVQDWPFFINVLFSLASSRAYQIKEFACWHNVTGNFIG